MSALVRWFSDDTVTQLQITVAILVIWAGIAYAVGRYGQSKGYPFSPCFFLCFLISPIAVWLIVCLLPERARLAKPMPLEMILEIEKARLAKLGARDDGGSVG